MRVADWRMYFTWIALAIYCSLFFPIGITILRRLDRKTRLPLVVSFPAVWVALEFFRANFASGFAWYLLGYSQHQWLAIAQIADVGGVYAVSFLVAAVNALLLELATASPWTRKLFVLPDAARRASRWPLIWQTAGVLALLVGTIAYGISRLRESSDEPGPRVALIQGNVPQSARNDVSSDETADAMFKHFAALCDTALTQKPPPDLVVWPETSFPGYWTESADGKPTDTSRQLARHFVERWPADILLGLNTLVGAESSTPLWYNSALLIGKDGKTKGRYDKIHRVPFGEYVPLRKVLPFMDWFAPYDFDYGIEAGEVLTLFRLRSNRFGALICYEDTDPYLARQYVNRASDDKADFLVNISNDGWFKGTSEHQEHLAICRFRAIESRRAIVRAVNMGVSAIIDGNGRVSAPQPPESGPASEGRVWEVASGKDVTEWPAFKWHRLKKISAVVTGRIPIDKRFSFYARAGDWFPWTCWVLVGLGLALSSLRPARTTH
jgi:apolipoprotein N-acyltransferase